NHYGPTENTVVSTCGRVAPLATEPPPIGRPIANTRCYVLDGAGQPAPVGAPGELHLGGGQVRRRHLGRPPLTAARFDPRAAAPRRPRPRRPPRPRPPRQAPPRRPAPPPRPARRRRARPPADRDRGRPGRPLGRPARAPARRRPRRLLRPGRPLPARHPAP